MEIAGPYQWWSLAWFIQSTGASHGKNATEQHGSSLTRAFTGLAVGFGAGATFSLIIAYAYDERTPFALAGYMSVMVAIPRCFGG
jgi:hypothetical protein